MNMVSSRERRRLEGKKRRMSIVPWEWIGSNPNFVKTGERSRPHREGRLPKLVQESEIKGDLHVHSKWSDGTSSIEEIARAAQKRGYQYVAICDHSKSLKIAHGLDESRLMKQIEEIDRLNEKTEGLSNS